MITNIVFDLDDTLFPEREFVRSGFIAVGQWVSLTYSEFSFFDIAWKLFNQGQRQNIFDQVLNILGLTFDNDVIQEMLHVYRSHLPTISLYEDAKWAMAYFQQYRDKCDGKMGLITDGYLKTQQNKVSALGIQSCFDAIVYSDFYGRNCWKPSPIPYQKIVQLMSCDPQDCVYIGDNPSKDFISAKKLGWLTIHVDRAQGEYSGIDTPLDYSADLSISSLVQLETIFLTL